MATFKPVAKPKPIKISKFLGLNTSVGETEIKLGEAVSMENYKITKNYKPQKRKGHSAFIDYGNTKPVYGGWYGVIGSKELLVTVNDGKVYEYNFSTKLNTQIGTMTDAPTFIFYFQNKLYFMNGSQYKEYNGTTFQDVVPYEPVIAVETPPTGGGTNFEETNNLTGAKWQEFLGNGTSTEFVLKEQNIDADLVQAKVNGATKVETTDFTVNRTTGKVAFLVAPPNESLVEIRWVKVIVGQADLIKKHKFAIKFGPSNDTNIFIWGNPDEKNTYRVSGTEKPNYFPANSLYRVSDNEYEITSLKPQYDRLLIYKRNRTHYTYAQTNPFYETNQGLNPYIYPSYDLNESVGNEPMNGVQLVENDPVSIKSQSVWRWSNTQVEDERNASIVSDRVKELLLEEDLSNAVTFDYQREKELWINVENRVYVWNYGNDTWYFYRGIKGYWFTEIDEVYFGSDGKVFKRGSQNDDGVAINSYIELGFTDFGINNLYKNTRKIWITLQPEGRTSCVVNFATDREEFDENNEQEVVYAFLNFNDVDFNFFPFTTNPNPQGERLRVRAKKYQYIKYRFENNRLNQGLTILNFEVQADASGEVK